MGDFEMEVIDGVRVRPEDVEAAKKRLAAKREAEATAEKAAQPKNKARTASNKEG